MSNEYKDWLIENEKEKKLKQSRIDIIGQNGNDGCHYSSIQVEDMLEEFLFNYEYRDKDFLYQVLNELKERKKMIKILQSDLARMQGIVGEYHLG